MLHFSVVFMTDNNGGHVLLILLGLCFEHCKTPISSKWIDMIVTIR